MEEQYGQNENVKRFKQVYIYYAKNCGAQRKITVVRYIYSLNFSLHILPKAPLPSWGSHFLTECIL
jgi:hypothetical protein